MCVSSPKDSDLYFDRVFVQIIIEQILWGPWKLGKNCQIQVEVLTFNKSAGSEGVNMLHLNNII